MVSEPSGMDTGAPQDAQFNVTVFIDLSQQSGILDVPAFGLAEREPSFYYLLWIDKVNTGYPENQSNCFLV